MTPNMVLAGDNVTITCCVDPPDRFVLHPIDILWSYDADGEDKISDNNTDITLGPTTNELGQFRKNMSISSLSTSAATDYYCIASVVNLNLSMTNDTSLNIQSENYTFFIKKITV